MLQAWRDLVVDLQAGRHCEGGCPIGSLAAELAEIDPAARDELGAGFARWEDAIRDGLTAMRERGELRVDADPTRLATTTLAGLQGGLLLLLTQVRRDTAPVEAALDMAIAHVRSFLAPEMLDGPRMVGGRAHIPPSWSRAVNVDVRVQTVICAPAEDVAAYASDPSHAPTWYANISSVEWKTPPPALPGSRIAFVAHFLGRRIAYTYEIIELVPGERLVMRTAQRPFPMETTYTWEVVDAGTLMSLRNTGTPSGFGSITAPLMARAMRAATTKDLARLKSILEEAARRG